MPSAVSYGHVDVFPLPYMMVMLMTAYDLF